MSTGFHFAFQTHWGTNVFVQQYLEALSQIATERFGAADPLTLAICDKRDTFVGGKVVYLDDALASERDRKRFVQLLDQATDKLLRENVLSNHSRKLVAYEIQTLRDRIEAAKS